MDMAFKQILLTNGDRVFGLGLDSIVIVSRHGC